MKLSLALSAGFASAALAQQSSWGQCGGPNWSGATTCMPGWTCNFQNPWYSQCSPDTTSSVPAVANAAVGECGGAASTTASSASSTTLATSTRTTTTTTSTVSPSPSDTASNKDTSSPPPAASSATASPVLPTKGQVKFTGVNIAGFDFGCSTDGTCDPALAYPPLLQYSNHDGPGQMAHFVKDTGMNCMRLPVGWQYLVNQNLGGTLDATNMAKYDMLMQACLATGSNCIIDIHNYARWNGGIIGQGGPADAQFASVWSQLATKYAKEDRVIFGVMNEPHDIPSITTWAATVQAVVTAIRGAGANSQMILLPGTDYTSAAQFVVSGSLDALKKVTNPDGTTINLIFDVHKYLDSDSSGTNAECVTNAINEAHAPLATALRAIGRQALLSETGGGNTASCKKYLCEEVAFISANSDVFLGFLGWSAGSFDSSYVLSQAPLNVGGVLVDTELVAACMKR